jgi:hypothetical protein
MPATVIQLIVILGLATVAMGVWMALDPYVRWLFWDSLRHPLTDGVYDPERRARRSDASDRG